MARYTIVIDLDGDAFAETITDARAEVARLLLIHASRLNSGTVSLIDHTTFIDANGNTCGRAMATLGPTAPANAQAFERELSMHADMGHEWPGRDE